MKTVAQKMGINENCRAIMITPPPGIIETLGLPQIDLSENLADDFDYIHLFVKNQAEQKKIFLKLKSHLKLKGMLWVSWPKGGQLGTDLSLPEVVKVGYQFGLVESTCISVDNVWSALKFTHPKKGKIYKNSHTELEKRTTNR